MITNDFLKKQLIKKINSDTYNQQYWIDRWNKMFPNEKISFKEAQKEKKGEKGKLNS